MFIVFLKGFQVQKVKFGATCFFLFSKVVRKKVQVFTLPQQIRLVNKTQVTNRTVLIIGSLFISLHLHNKRWGNYHVVVAYVGVVDEIVSASTPVTQNKWGGVSAAAIMGDNVVGNCQ